MQLNRFKKKVSAEEGKDFTNIWSYYPNARFGIFRRILITFLLITLLPLSILGIYTLNTISDVGDEIVDKTTRSLNQKTRDALELQAVYTASAVHAFLKHCEKDLVQLSELQINPRRYLKFYNANQSEIWIRTGTNKAPEEVHKNIPIYKEVAFVNKQGREIIKIKNGKIQPSDSLKNVRYPKNTTYKCETYFSKTIGLAPGEIYVSHLNGFYVSKKEQLQGVERVDEAIEGKKYDGVIRFAMPLYRNGRLLGIVVLGLDHRHLMEFTQHILPNQKMKTVFPSYYSGNYAFMFDDQGWIITHPKYWDIRGVDRSGKAVPAYTGFSLPKDIEQGRIPFNLDSAAFIHNNYPLVARRVRDHQSGSVITTNVGGITKIMAYAPIFYNTGPYKKYGVFGGVTIGEELKSFQLPAFFVGNSIITGLMLVRKNLFWILAATLFFSLILSWYFSRSITNPVIKIMRAARSLAFGETTRSITLNRKDEIGVLTKVFNFMAYELNKSRGELLTSYNRLKNSKAAIERYTKDLEYQLKILGSIQKISNILGSTFDIEAILKLILQNCVESIGFDRAILYLLGEKGDYLECRETFGFSIEEEELARRSKYHIGHFDCIETRVAKEGQIIFVPDFRNYPAATELDKKIRFYGKSNSFVFIPLKVKEKIIGILGADKLRSAKPISDLDIKSLQILANQAARVIENTRLYREIIRQKNFVEDVLRYMINGVITVDKDGTITSINQSARTILSLSKQETLNKNAWQVFMDNHNLLKKIQERLRTRGFYHGYHLEYIRDEQMKYININASVMSSETKEVSGSIVILEDVTQRKQLDDHIQRIQRLASLGRFAAGIAHEIRNPLTGVSLFLDDLHDKLSARPEIASLVAMALAEIERLENLTNEVLAYANPDRGNYSEKNINELIRTTLKFVDKQCRNAKIEIHNELDKAVKPIRMNPEKIRQAFLNIIINAIQAMPTGGRLTVKTRWLHSYGHFVFTKNKFEGISDWVLIRIEDSGPGIPPEDWDRIFEPFYTNKKDGTGLGLSTTHNIISEHGGKIEVTNRRRGGARFIIHLPKRSVPENQVKFKGE